MGLTATPRETEIQHAILALLRVLSIPAWRNNSRVFRVGDRLIRASVKGASDILAVLPPSGRFLAIEVKRPGAKPTLEQTAFLNVITRAGGVGIVATCPNDVVQALARVGWEAT